MHRALDVGQAPHAAGPRVERADVLDDAGIAERAVQRGAALVVVEARNRAQRARDELAHRRDRELAHLGQVLPLELVLEHDPLLPRLFQRQAEHVLELVGVVALAVLVAPDPVDDLLRRVGVGEPREEAPAVEVGIRAGLEVDLGPAGDEPQRIVEVGVVAHHRAEHHLVVAALRAAEAAGHPRLEEDRAALGIPPWRGEARNREVAVEQRLGKLRLRRHLAQEELAPAQVLLRRDVALHDVHQLVVHRRVHALAGRRSLERAGVGRDVHDELAARRGSRVRVAVVDEVLQQHHRALGRLPAEHPAMPVPCVGERADRERREIGEVVVVVELDVPGVDLGEVDRTPLGFDLGDVGRMPLGFDLGDVGRTPLGVDLGDVDRTLLRAARDRDQRQQDAENAVTHAVPFRFTRGNRSTNDRQKRNRRRGGRRRRRRRLVPRGRNRRRPALRRHYW